MFLGKFHLIEERNVSNGSTAEVFTNVFDDALTLGFRNVKVEIEGLDETGANIALRYINSAGSTQSGTDYTHGYARIVNTSGSPYIQASGISLTNRHYDFLWKGGNFGEAIFINPTAVQKTYALWQRGNYNAVTWAMHQQSTAMGGFRLYNDAGGNFAVAAGEYAKIKVYGIEDS